MNSTETRIFDTASPELFLNDGSMSLERPVHSMPYGEDALANTGAREMTRKQWEDLKPLIEQIYIKENQPFPYLAEVLRRDYGFEPTKRQFSRKIIQWGFRKNVPRAERRLILEQLPRDSAENVPDFKDYRLKQTKLNNWRRRYRDAVRVRPCPPIHGGGSRQETPSIIECKAVIGGTKINHVNREVSMTKNVHHPDGVREINSIGISFIGMCQTDVPFEWSKVEITGFPELFPLLKALRSEWAAHDQPFLLDEIQYDTTTFLSNSELQELSNGSHVKTEDFQTCLSIRTKNMEAIKHRTKYSSPQYPWRDAQSVFFGHSITPLDEIYVFPPSQEALLASKARVENLWGSLSAEALELETKLFKLEGQFGENNVAVIATTEHLAALYYRLDCFRKAELMNRRLVAVYCRSLGPMNRRTLEAGLAMVESYLEQGHLVKAQAENQALQSKILKAFEHDHPLTVSANYAYGRICRAHERNEEAEKYFRQHLQIMLLWHGPKAMATVRAMSSLSKAIVKRKPKEAGILLFIAGQLSIESPVVDEGPCRSLAHVADNLIMKGAFKESYCLAAKSIERFSIPLGDQHPAIWEAREKLAWNMGAMGNRQESVKTFRAVISHQELRALDFSEFNSNSWCGLARVLLEMGAIEKATTWYEKTFDARVVLYGSSNDFTLFTGYRLGYCYYTQRKYGEALDFYEKMVHLLHESGKSGTTVSVFESCILHLQRKIAEGHN